MPSYTFKGTEERYYTDHGLTAKPGDVVGLDGPLDDMWELSDGSAPVAAEPVAEPVVEVPAEPIAEPVVEPVVESVVESVAEPKPYSSSF